MVWTPSDVTGACVRMSNRSAVPYEEISCLYSSSIGRTYMDWEYNVPIFGVWEWMEQNSWCPIAAVVLYGVTIVGGQHYFKTRPALDLRVALALWNLALAIFSAWGFARMLPLLMHNFGHYSLRDNLCEPAVTLIGTSVNCMWTLVFIWSKFFELLDTAFIVVRKKKLLFLHWYHHVTVLLACWHAWITETPGGYIFCTVNYGVHAVMYFYYALMAAHCRPKWFNPMVITIMQIAQMVVGVFVSVMTYVLLQTSAKEPCYANKQNILIFFGIYASYLCLFAQFFLDRYFNTVVKAKVTKPKPKAS